MNKLLLYLALAFSAVAFAQEKQPALVPFLQDGKFGYADSTGQMVINPKYEQALPFYKGYDLSYAVNKGKAQIINRKGKTVLKGATDYFKKNKFGLIYRHFPEKPELLYTKNHCLQKSCPTIGIIEAFSEQKVFDKMKSLYFITNKEKVFLADKQGKRMTELYDKIKHYDYGEIEYCITYDDELKKQGLLDDNGQAVLQCVYDAIIYKGKGVFELKQGSFTKDFTLPTKEYSNKTINNSTKKRYKIQRKNRKAGVVDRQGVLKIPHQYDRLFPLNEDKFVFWKGIQAGIMDINEMQVYTIELEKDFSEVSNRAAYVPYAVYNDDFVFFQFDKKWHLINLNGQQIGENYDGIFMDTYKIIGAIAGVCSNTNAGVINSKGESILSLVYDEIYGLRSDKSYVVRKGDKWSWRNRSGETIYEGFDDFRYTLSGFLFVNKAEVWYYVASDGTEFKK